MLKTLVRLDKMAALCQIFSHIGMLAGSMSSHYLANTKTENDDDFSDMQGVDGDVGEDDEDNKDKDSGAAEGTQGSILCDVKLATKSCTFHRSF